MFFASPQHRLLRAQYRGGIQFFVSILVERCIYYARAGCVMVVVGCALYRFSSVFVHQATALVFTRLFHVRVRRRMPHVCSPHVALYCQYLLPVQIGGVSLTLVAVYGRLHRPALPAVNIFSHFLRVAVTPVGRQRGEGTGNGVASLPNVGELCRKMYGIYIISFNFCLV